jgi:hypothetical protein
MLVETRFGGLPNRLIFAFKVVSRRRIVESLGPLLPFVEKIMRH